MNEMRQSVRFWSVLTGVLTSALLFAASANAATITLKAADGGADSSNTADSVCSLREAIDLTNDDTTVGHETDCTISGTLGTDDTIVLAPGVTYSRTIDPGGHGR
jgi:hypothetical protein